MFKNFLKKRKLSIDFTHENYKLLNEFTDQYQLSNNYVINFFLEHLLKLSPENKFILAKAIHDRISTLQNIEKNSGSFAAQDNDLQIDLLKGLLSFFTEGKGYQDKIYKPMKRFDLKTGYVVMPDDWLICAPERAKYCEYCGVIEMRNSSKYKTPHIAFFSEFPIHKLLPSQEESILNECEMIYPNLNFIRKMQIEPVYDKNGVMQNSDIWSMAPIIGFFAVPEFSTTESYPEGAMIFRDYSFDYLKSKNMTSDNPITDRYIEQLFRSSVKDVLMLLMQNLAADQSIHNPEQKHYLLVTLAMDIVSCAFNSTMDSNYMYLYDEHFPSKCKIIANVLQTDIDKISYDESVLRKVKEDILLLNNSSKNGVTFVPYNYFEIVIRNWQILGDNSTTFSMLYDVIALSNKEIWEKPEYKFKAINCIKEVTADWKE